LLRELDFLLTDSVIGGDDVRAMDVVGLRPDGTLAHP